MKIIATAAFGRANVPLFFSDSGERLQISSNRA